MENLFQPYMLGSIFSQMYVYFIMIGALLPVGVLVHTYWQYKKQGINDDKQVGIKLVLHLIRVAGLNLAVVSIAMMISLLIAGVRELWGIYKFLIPMLISGVGIFIGADQVLARKTNNSKFMIIQQTFSTLLAFGYLVSAITAAMTFLIGLFQIGERSAGKVLVIAAVCTLIFGAFGVYFLLLKLNEGKPEKAAK
ncbi:MAG: hypothetical protein JW874_07020 [Spirochaetales bacterium]|nr:hypothetical protein [Spirochaetales bacterium]